MPERRARIRQVLEVGRPGPVLQVVEVSHEGGLGKEFLGSNMVEVVGVCEGLDKLDEKGQYLTRWEYLFVDGTRGCANSKGTIYGGPKKRCFW